MKWRNHWGANGFTLIEVLVAIVVMAILAMVSIPVYDQYIYKSRRGDAYATLEVIALAQEQWRANHVTYGNLADLWPQGVSKNGYYTIAIGNVTATTFLVTATAKSGTPQSKDTACSTIQLDQNGPLVDTNARKICWNR